MSDILLVVYRVQTLHINAELFIRYQDVAMRGPYTVISRCQLAKAIRHADEEL